MRLILRLSVWRVAALLLALSAVTAAHANVWFKHLTTEEGLAADQVFTVIQDRRGYIWLGTDNGLERYDGYTFKTFKHDPNDAGSLSGNYIRALFEDSEGRLWVGTFGNGLDLYDPKTDKFRHYRHNPQDSNSIISDTVWSLAEGPNDTILIGTYDAGIDVFSPRLGTFNHYPTNSGENSPSDNRINSVATDNAKTIWLATESGLDRFSGRKSEPTRRFDRSGAAGSNIIWGITQDRHGRFWVATQHGAAVFNPNTGSFASITGAPPSLDNDFIHIAFIDNRGNAWFGSAQSGLFLVPADGGRIEHFQHDSNNPDSLRSNEIWDIFQDKTGLLWIATADGINILDINSLNIRYVKPSDIDSSRQGAANTVSAITEYRETMLFGSTAGIYRTPLIPGTDITGQSLFCRIDESLYGKVTALANDGVNVFAGTEAGYLFEISGSGHVAHRWLIGGKLGLRGRAIHRILKLNASDLLLGSFGNGLIRFDSDTAKTSQIVGPMSDGLSKNDNIEELVMAPTGIVWAGTFRGLFKVNPRDNGSTVVPLDPGRVEPVIQAVHIDDHRNMWIGTFDGLWRMPLNDRYEPQSTPQSVPQFKGELVLGIEQDTHSKLWLATINALVRFDTATNEMLRYGKNQGSPISEYYSYGHYAASNGWLWFGGVEGAVGFLPDNIHPNEIPPSVIINGVTAYRGNEPIQLRSNPLTLSYQDRISIFDVAAMDFASPQANSYSYRLIGFQPDWTPPSELHQITFTNLNPGRYHLEVRAANNWGTWSTTPANLDIVVLPPWWRTWWAYTIYLLISFGSAIAYVYSLKRKILREKAISASLREANEIKSNFVEKLESQVQEATLELRETLQGVNLKNAELEIAQRRATEGEQVKSQFLANMSHELRTPLTGVLGYTKLLTSTNLSSEQKDYVSTIRVSSESLLAIINDTLDLSRLEAGKLLIDEVDFDLLELIESTLELLAPIAYQKRLELIRVIPADAPLHLRGDPLRMRQVLTNLLSNAIKFTESGSVCLEVQILEQADRDANIGFRIIDTGIGIPEGEIGQLFNAYNRGRISTRHQVEGTGLGLAICKKLLDLMGGTVGVESRVGTGSTFHFQVKFRLQKHAAPRQQLPKKLSILLYDKHPLSNAAWKASLTRLGADVREVTELESLMALQAEAAVLSLSERELAHLGELKQQFSPALPPMLILAPRIDRQTLKDLSERLYHRVLSKTAREKTVYLELQSLVQHAIHAPEPVTENKPAAVAPTLAPDAPLVLVADDNRINRRLLVTMLGHAGFRTAEAGNGIELLDLAARGGWQAAILDIHMPGMDGIETATRLRVIYGEATPPIIAMSADVLPGGQGGPQQGLMDDFLMKPFNEHQLVELLRQHLARRERRHRDIT